jgi:hypothetical protein
MIGSGEALFLARLRAPRLVFASSARGDVMTFGAKINVLGRRSADSARLFVKMKRIAAPFPRF